MAVSSDVGLTNLLLLLISKVERLQERLKTARNSQQDVRSCLLGPREPSHRLCDMCCIHLAQGNDALRRKIDQQSDEVSAASHKPHQRRVLLTSSPALNTDSSIREAESRVALRLQEATTADRHLETAEVAH